MSSMTFRSELAQSRDRHIKSPWASSPALLPRAGAAELLHNCFKKLASACLKSFMARMQEKYHLELPQYPCTSQCVKISSAPGRSDPSQIRLNYDLAEKGGGLLEEDVDPDPMKQFAKWFQVLTNTVIPPGEATPAPAYLTAPRGRSVEHYDTKSTLMIISPRGSRYMMQWGNPW